jgi:gluconate 2-dehydrogenase gamma chain
MSALSTATPASPYKPAYFNATEWITLNALVDRLIPADEEGPGAIEAGVAEFIDRQMDTPYGHGELWYMHGPFNEDLPALFGYQLHFAPRELYRAALARVERVAHEQQGKAFSELDNPAKDQFLNQMEIGGLKMEPVPSAAFFAQLLQNVHEGYFCDPKYGGNKNMAAWRMVGFPGARADYMDWVEQYGKAYPLPPVSLG